MNDWILNAAICFLLVIAVPGCQKTAPPAEPPYAAGRLSRQSWSPTVADPLPGIDQAYCGSFWIPQTPEDQHLVLLFWFDVYGANAKWSDRVDGFDGQVDHIPIEFHLKSKTSDDGTLNIAGTDYDTTNGSLFLISTEQENPVVKQLNRSLAELDILTADGSGIDTERLKALARTDADISTFFRDAADKPNAP